MKLNTFFNKLNEAVAVHSEALLAYVITIAEAYAEAPEVQPDQVWRWQALVFSNTNLMKKVISKVKVIPTQEDPYPDEIAMIKDIAYNKRLYVYTGHSDHPAMTQSQNVAFRVIHDYFAHAGSNTASLKKFYDTQQLVTQKDAAALANYAFPQGGSFTIRGEMNAYLNHAQVVGPDVLPALFTEILGQAATFFLLNDFPVQKVAILDGFDYRRLGVCTGARQQRMQELLTQIKDPQVGQIQTKVNNFVLDKARINWKLLSKGTAGRQVESIELDEMAGAGPSRIVTHIRNGQPFITFSAFRNEFEHDDNLKRDARLKQIFKALPISIIPVEGHFEETDATGNKIPVTEISYFIMPNSATDLKQFFKLGAKLCTMFGQQSFGFGDGKKIYFGYASGEKEFIGDAITFRPENIKKLPGFSVIKDRAFSFVKKTNRPPEQDDEVDASTAIKYNSPQSAFRPFRKPHLP